MFGHASTRRFASRVPFFYGWIVVAVAFISMAIGVNARTSFSLLFPPILDEFGWDRATIAATFSIGFVTSTILSPLVGALMDKYGPRLVLPLGATLTALGFYTATFSTEPWHFYLTLGVLVVGGSLFTSYIGHTAFLPNWFNRHRGLAIGLAFSGVGVGSITLFPWMQDSILTDGWRETSISVAILLIVVLVPLNAMFQRRKPHDLGLLPDGDDTPDTDRGAVQKKFENARIVDAAWVSTSWTLSNAIKTSRFWWVTLAFSSGLYAWYAVQVHQTKFLIDVGISPSFAAVALGLVGLTGIGGQICVGHLSDKIGREWGWTVSLLGFFLTYFLLQIISEVPSEIIVYLMVGAQGFMGYGLASVFGTVPAELFGGKRYGVIFGTLGAFAGMGAALGPWATGWLFDLRGNYYMAFNVAMGMCLISIAAMWLASPRKVRLVAGRVPEN